VTPTVHDVRGAPIPGLPGVLPHPTAPHGEERFRQLLQQILDTSKATAPAARRALPVHGTAPNRPPRQPAFRPHASRGATPGAAAKATPAEGAKGALRAAIRQASTTAGVEPALSVAVARAESSLNPKARSADGQSVGTFQVTRATAAEMRRKIAAGTVERPPGSDDVALGVGYLRYLHDLFGRNATLGKHLSTVAVADDSQRRLFAVAAFNAGEGSVARAQAKAAAAGADPTRFADVRQFLPESTQGYVERVVAYAQEELPRATAV
jgi:soluble lytic murein transglycosylase-like protein